jgi:hypothetical protein
MQRDLGDGFRKRSTHPTEATIIHSQTAERVLHPISCHH